MPRVGTGMENTNQLSSSILALESWATPGATGAVISHCSEKYQLLFNIEINIKMDECKTYLLFMKL